MVSSQNNVRKYRTKGHEQVYCQLKQGLLTLKMLLNLKLVKLFLLESMLYPKGQRPLN